MNILIIGGGSVGQVYGRILAAGGHALTFFVRERQVAGFAKGMRIYPLNTRAGRERGFLFKDFELASSYAQLKNTVWDQIYFCVSSMALEDELFEGIQGIMGQASIIKLQPGLSDRAKFDAHFPEEQIISGMISMIAYSAPLEGEAIDQPGTAFWFPPMTGSRFSGEAKRLELVLESLRAGGMRAQSHADIEKLLATVLALEVPFLAGLENADWSFKAYGAGEWLTIARQAMAEALRMIRPETSRTAIWLLRLLNPLSLSLASWVARIFIPIPMEIYLEAHFTKVQAQSRQHLREMIALGNQKGAAVGNLKALLAGIGGK